MDNKEIARLLGGNPKDVLTNNLNNNEKIMLICLVDDMEITVIRNKGNFIAEFKNIHFKIDTRYATECIKILPIFFLKFKENVHDFVFSCTSCNAKVTIEDINIDAENSGFADFKFLENDESAYCVECFASQLEWDGEVLEYIY